MKYFFTPLFLLPLFLFAQSNYKPGYVVTLNGDTLKGYIDYREWGRNPVAISFKMDLTDSRPQTFSVANASLFVVKGYEYYRRYAVKVSTAEVATNLISRGIDTSYKTDTVFLRLLTTGNHVALFKYTDKIKDRYYIAEGNQKPYELIYRVYLTSNEGESTSVTQTRYKQQLLSLAAVYQPNDSRLTRDIESVGYSSDLKRIVIELNDSKASALFTEADKINNIRLFAGIGFNLSSVKINGNVQYSKGVSLAQGIADLNGYSGFSSSSVSLFPVITAGGDIFLNKNVGTLVIRGELSITGTKISLNSTSPENTNVPTSGYYYNSVFTLNQYTIALKPQVLYTFYNKTALKIYVGGGGALNLAAYSNKQSYRTYYPSQTIENETFSSTQSVYFNIVAKAGFIVNNKIDVHFGYEPAASSAYPSMMLTSYQAAVNYIFGKSK